MAGDIDRALAGGEYRRPRQRRGASRMEVDVAAAYAVSDRHMSLCAAGPVGHRVNEEIRMRGAAFRNEGRIACDHGRRLAAVRALGEQPAAEHVDVAAVAA